MPDLLTISPTLPGPTASPTVAPDPCIDDPTYTFPINSNIGFEIFVNSPLTCQQFGVILSPVQITHLRAVLLSAKMTSPILNICPINPKYGYKVYCETDCNKWAPFLSYEEMGDARCDFKGVLWHMWDMRVRSMYLMKLCSHDL